LKKISDEKKTTMTFHIGIQHKTDGLCESLCTIDAPPLTPLQLQRIIDTLDREIIAVLPHRIAVDDLIEDIQKQTGATVTDDTDHGIGRGMIQVALLFIRGSPNNWRYFEYGTDGRIEELAAFLYQ
jgi:hypothetical protein